MVIQRAMIERLELVAELRAALGRSRVVLQVRSASWRWSSASSLLAAGLALGCGAADTDASRGGSSADWTNPEWPFTTPEAQFQVCPGPLGHPEDLAATPRADENLEFLALVLEPDAVVVSQATYERVVADVAAIRALVPELAPIEYRPPHDGRSAWISFGSIAVDVWAMGAFSGLDCLNEALGATYRPAFDNFDFYYRPVSLRGIHNMPLVAQLYSQLPDIAAGELTGGPGDGPTWCVGRDGSDYEYVIDQAMGGCSSGCQEHEAHHFSSEVAGEATPLEVWRSADGQPPPAWYTRLCP
jgi:hypothetical protein